MKLFELIPQKITDLLPPLLNKEVPPPIDQVALQLVEITKTAGFAGIGLAIKTREFTKDTFNELVALGEESMGIESERPEAVDKVTTEENKIEEKPAEPTQED